MKRQSSTCISNSASGNEDGLGRVCLNHEALWQSGVPTRQKDNNPERTSNGDGADTRESNWTLTGTELVLRPMLEPPPHFVDSLLRVDFPVILLIFQCGKHFAY